MSIFKLNGWSHLNTKLNYGEKVSFKKNFYTLSRKFSYDDRFENKNIQQIFLRIQYLPKPHKDNRMYPTA